MGLQPYEVSQEQGRTELFTLYCTPEEKKELCNASDNAAIQLEIVRRIFKNDKDFIEQELSKIDEGNLRYKAKLLEIKNNFSKSQDEIDEMYKDIYKKADNQLKILSENNKQLDDRIDNTIRKVKSLSEAVRAIDSSIGHFNIEHLERLISLADKYNSMTVEQKEFLKLVVKKEEL